MIIVWDDGHKSQYDYNWLKRREFTENNQKNYLENVYRPSRKLWSKNDYFKILNVYQYNDVINKWVFFKYNFCASFFFIMITIFFSDKTFYNWLNSLATYGVTLIKNASTDEADCRKLVEKVAFIRKTHYGYGQIIYNIIFILLKIL